MVNAAELNDIALTLLQVTGLLLPVVFLTINFVKKEGLDQFSEDTQQNIANLLLLMISSLTITGLFASLGILNLSIKDLILFISVCSLSVFFLLYGIFIYMLVK